MIMNEIKAVLFDFGGTLDHDGVDWFSRFYGHIHRLGGTIERDDFQLCADRAAGLISADPGAPEWLMDEMVLRLSERMAEQIALHQGADPSWEPSALAEAFMADCRTCLQRNVTTVARLAECFRVGCVSNNWGNTAGWCRQFGLDRYFEVMVDSAVVGASKPDPRIFEAALEELHLPAEQCVYVGDRFDCDVIGAARVGMTPIWITSGNYYGTIDASLEPIRIAVPTDLLELDMLSCPSADRR